MSCWEYIRGNGCPRKELYCHGLIVVVPGDADSPQAPLKLLCNEDENKL